VFKASSGIAILGFEGSGLVHHSVSRHRDGQKIIWK
jgi:hypothetical protein